MSDETEPQAEIMSEETDSGYLRLLEAILFASAEPISERMLSNRLPEGANVRDLLAKLQNRYADRGITLNRAGKMWSFRTAPDLVDQLNKEKEVKRKMSRAAIETLAIIAYHQPVTRAEIEEIRGVSLSKGTLDHLFEEGWINPRGHRDTPGRPMMWGTTDIFLDHFGLEDVKSLPGMEELSAAGLLDARPAIQAYRITGEDGDSEPQFSLGEDVDDGFVAESEIPAPLPENDEQDNDEAPAEKGEPGTNSEKTAENA